MELSSIGKTLRLAGPLSASQLVVFLFSFLDAAAFGNFGVNAVSAAAISLSFLITVQLLGSGTVTCVGIILARRIAANKMDGAAAAVTGGIVFSCLYFIVASGLVAGFVATQSGWNADSQIADLVGSYLYVATFGIPFSLMFIVFRGVLIASGDTTTTLRATLASLLLKACINFAVILYVEDVRTAAVTLAAGSVACSVLTVLIIYRSVPASLAPLSISVPNAPTVFAALLAILREGLPIGLTYAFEAAIFAAVSVILGWVSPVALAAHYVVKQYVNFTFLMLTGIGHVASIRVSDALGRADLGSARRVSFECLGLTAIIVAAISVLYLVFPRQLISLVIEPSSALSEQVRELAVPVFMIAVAMQLFDNIQNVLAGILRGYKKSAFTLVATIIGYWVVGLPTICLLSLFLDLGVIGAWLGLTAGLCVLTGILWSAFEKASAEALSASANLTTTAGETR